MVDNVVMLVDAGGLYRTCLPRRRFHTMMITLNNSLRGLSLARACVAFHDNAIRGGESFRKSLSMARFRRNAAVYVSRDAPSHNCCIMEGEGVGHGGRLRLIWVSTFRRSHDDISPLDSASISTLVQR